jgi:hypothetical protein
MAATINHSFLPVKSGDPELNLVKEGGRGSGRPMESRILSELRGIWLENHGPRQSLTGVAKSHYLRSRSRTPESHKLAISSLFGVFRRIKANFPAKIAITAISLDIPSEK